MDEAVKNAMRRKALMTSAMRFVYSLQDRESDNPNEARHKANLKETRRKRNKVAKRSRVDNLKKRKYGQRRKSRHKTKQKV